MISKIYKSKGNIRKKYYMQIKHMHVCIDKKYNSKIVTN